MRKKGFTLIELLVVIAIIAMLMAILMPALSKVKKIAMRVVCGTNLKGLGTAQTVYAQDYEDEYVVQGQGGPHTWAENTAEWQITTKDWKTGADITVGASLYLLVREADVSPKSFVCPSGDQQEYDGKNDYNLDIVQLWDFGHSGWSPQTGPTNSVSYSYHQPYGAGQNPAAASTGSIGRYAASGTRSAAFAMMADKNPYSDQTLDNGGVTSIDLMRERVAPIGTDAPPAPGGDWDDLEKWRVQAQNTKSHDREGQNVLYADGHSAYQDRADVGIKNDCIYTQWSNNGLTEADRRRGTFPANRDSDFAPQGNDDSVLVSDDATIQ